MISTANNNKNKVISIVSAVLLGAVSILGLQNCSSGGGDSTSTTVNVSGGSVVEGDTGTQSITFTVAISAAAGANTSVDYATSDGTAVSGTDYTATTGTLAIPAGATSSTVTVDVAGDTAFEFDETFALTLTNPVAAALGAAASATGTITNDDNAVPKGYYTGSATLDNINLPDVRALVYNNRIIMFSVTSNDMYDMDITVVGDSFIGPVNVYGDGNITQDVTVSGTTTESQIQGTFAGGTGVAAGTFTLLFDTPNNSGATLARIETVSTDRWRGGMYGITDEAGVLIVQVNGDYLGADSVSFACAYPVTLTATFSLPVPDLNIYTMAHDVEDNGSTCPYASSGHTGFASVINNGGTDNEVVFAFSNGAIALFGIMNH